MKHYKVTITLSNGEGVEWFITSGLDRYELFKTFEKKIRDGVLNFADDETDFIYPVCSVISLKFIEISKEERLKWQKQRK